MAPRKGRPRITVYDVWRELNTRHTIPVHFQERLEDRLVIAFQRRGRQPRAKVARAQKQILANARLNKSHKVYMEVLDQNCHAFLPFILAVSPRACASFDVNRFLRESRCHKLNFTIETKPLLDGIASRGGFVQHSHYQNLIGSIFSAAQTCRNVNQQQEKEESISYVLEPERTGIGAEFDPDAVPEISDVATTAIASPRVIQFEKSTLEMLVLEKSAEILGEIWFGSPPGFPPFVSLRLEKKLGDIIRPSGRDVLIPGAAPGANRTFRGVYSIELEHFRRLIRRDGFGAIFWNECREEAFVTMQVMDKNLIEDFIQVSQVAVGVLPRLDAVSTGSPA